MILKNSRMIYREAANQLTAPAQPAQPPTQPQAAPQQAPAQPAAPTQQASTTNQQIIDFFKQKNIDSKISRTLNDLARAPQNVVGDVRDVISRVIGETKYALEVPNVDQTFLKAIRDYEAMLSDDEGAVHAPAAEGQRPAPGGSEPTQSPTYVKGLNTQIKNLKQEIKDLKAQVEKAKTSAEAGKSQVTVNILNTAIAKAEASLKTAESSVPVNV